MSRIDAFKEKLWESVQGNTVPWTKSWKAGRRTAPYNMVTGADYHGCNSFYLSMASMEDPRWCGFSQAKKAGWKIRKGSKGMPILVAMAMKKNGNEEDDGGEDKTFTIYGVKHVFHASQMEDAPDPEISEMDHELLIKSVETAIKFIGVNTQHTDVKDPCYNKKEDLIYIPFPNNFSSIESYYRTLFHEIAHAMEHDSRLGRNESDLESPETSRMKREIRAEIASYMFCMELKCGFDLEDGADSHSAYVKSWLSGASDPKEELYLAVKGAVKVVDYALYEYRAYKASLEEMI